MPPRPALASALAILSGAAAQQEWLLAEPGHSCSTACNIAGKKCREAALAARNGDVDTTGEVNNAFAALNTTCGAFNTNYGANPDVPLYDPRDTVCYVSDAGRGTGTFDCDRTPDPLRKQRLCFCDTRLHWEVDCEDTPGWGNAYPCWEHGNGAAEGCFQPAGFTCKAYELQGNCVDGAPATDKAYAFNAEMNNPEGNCCICGKTMTTTTTSTTSTTTTSTTSTTTTQCAEPMSGATEDQKRSYIACLRSTCNDGVPAVVSSWTNAWMPNCFEGVANHGCGRPIDARISVSGTFVQDLCPSNCSVCESPVETNAGRRAETFGTGRVGLPLWPILLMAAAGAWVPSGRPAGRR
mmetsp:Transcript_76475/g.212406  ORF Transcript_76475/g.212406 Transcript_76475/m.212406 type:complete len:352 (+) Transcript_76475:61-1116(+)